MRKKQRWPDFENWKEFGVEHNYEERNPYSLEESEDNIEKKWYNKGQREGWNNDFNYKRRRGKWKTKKEWVIYGIEQGFKDRSPASLENSEDREEKYWYVKGQREKWVESFKLSKVRDKESPWQEKETWIKYGLKQGYEERNAKSLAKSENKTERSWYNRGSNKKWLIEFSFNKKRHHKSPWQSEEEWREFGLERKYEDRNKTSLAESENKEERGWYARGAQKKWHLNFGFQRVRKLDGYYESWYNFEREMEEAIQENNGEFPTQIRLTEMRRSSLSGAVRYHGGFPVVRERMGYAELSNGSNLESLLEDYISQ